MDANTVLSLQQGTYGTEGQGMDWTYWDEIALTAAGASFSLFQNIQGRTVDQTNMVINGQIPSAQNFVIRCINLCYLSTAVKAAADIQTFFNWIMGVVLQIAPTGIANIFEKPLTEMFAIPIMMQATTTTATDVGVSSALMSTGRFLNTSILNVPITLAGNVTFKVTLSYPTALGGGNALIGDILRIGFNGYLVRAS